MNSRVLNVIICCTAEFTATSSRYLAPSSNTSYASKLSNSESQSELEASDGMRRSPRGESETEPTFGPSGIAERLNCCEKKRR